MLDRAILKAVLSVRLSVRLSVCHTREPRLNDTKYRNKFNTVRYSDVSSLLTLNSVVVEFMGSELHHKHMC